MIKIKIPYGFDTWIEFHDYLQKEYPKLLLTNKTLVFKTTQILRDTGFVKTHNVRIKPSTVKKNCWDEVQAKRPSHEAVMAGIHDMNYNNVSKDKVDEINNVLMIIKK